MPFSQRTLLLGGVALGSVAAFAMLARSVARRDTAAVDEQVRDRAAASPDAPARDAAEKVGPLGKWWTYVPAAVLTAAYATRRSGAGATAIVASATAAAILNRVFERVLEQPPAPPGRKSRNHPVFPSGHAFGTTAVAMAAAYVLSREELAAAAVVFPIAVVVPLISSVARMIEDKHWISDVAGGHVAGIAVSSACLAAYETMRR
jgi:membrane-associated phospholipid phosphatase